MKASAGPAATPKRASKATSTTSSTTSAGKWATVSADPKTPRAAATGRAVRGRTPETEALRVKEGETPWTTAELQSIREALEADSTALREEIEFAEHEIVSLMRHSGDGAGDDQADAGSKTFEREQEMSLANNAREMLIQNQHALERLAGGTYGLCESCGNPIGKLRLEAAPRATLCLTCKSRQERR